MHSNIFDVRQVISKLKTCLSNDKYFDKDEFSSLYLDCIRNDLDLEASQCTESAIAASNKIYSLQMTTSIYKAFNDIILPKINSNDYTSVFKLAKLTHILDAIYLKRSVYRLDSEYDDIRIKLSVKILCKMPDLMKKELQDAIKSQDETKIKNLLSLHEDLVNTYNGVCICPKGKIISGIFEYVNQQLTDSLNDALKNNNVKEVEFISNITDNYKLNYDGNMFNFSSSLASVTTVLEPAPVAVL